MSKTIYHYFKKLNRTKKYYILHFFITLLVGGGIFSAIQSINAQITGGFSIISTPTIQLHTGNYATTGTYGTIKLGGTGLLSFFQRSWNNINTPFYNSLLTSGSTIYFNNFDTAEVLNQNAVPLADSIRDFTGGTEGTGQNGWRYLYKATITSGTGQTGGIFKDANNYDCSVPNESYTNIYVEGISNRGDLDSFINTTGYTNTGLFVAYPGMTGTQYYYDTTLPLPHLADWECFDDGFGQDCWRLCTFSGGIGYLNATNLLELSYSGNTNLRTIGTNPIINHNFANIGKYYSHPGSGTSNSIIELSGFNNIPIIQQRTSNLSGKIKIINTLEDDDNNCGNGIKYTIYTGIIESGNTLTGVKIITGLTLPNQFTGILIEKDINILSGTNIFFEIDNNGNNECDATYNHIEIYDITTNTGISGGPTYTETGMYGGALEFSGDQVFSLGKGINQSSSGITIAAWVNTRDNTKKQGIITKYNAYGIVVKSGTIRVSPSTYWMRHDTGIPVENNTRTHVAWTYDGHTMALYKNGGSQNSGGRTRTYNINGTLNTNNNLTMIGYDLTNNRGRDGWIDEFRMYNIGFNSGQIQELYESNLKLVDSGANSYWEFISNKTGLVDNKYDYGYYGPNGGNGLIIAEADDIGDINSDFDHVPICTNCNNEEVCSIGNISSGYFINDQYVCRADDNYTFGSIIGGGSYFVYHTYLVSNITGSLLVDTKGPVLTGIFGLTGLETQQILTVTGIRYDTGFGSITTGIDRGYLWDDSETRSIATNTGNIVSFSLIDQNLVNTRPIKIKAKDALGNETIREDMVQRVNAGPPVFSGFIGTTGYESHNLIIQRTGYDPTLNTSTGFDWTITINGESNSYTNTGYRITIPAQNEPITGEISVVARDYIGYDTPSTGTIEWFNTGPVITDTHDTYSDIVEQTITFTASGYDTGGEELTYQWYSGQNCSNIILGATGNTFSTGSEFATTLYFSYKIFDNQGFGSTCKNITAIRNLIGEPFTYNRILYTNPDGIPNTGFTIGNGFNNNTYAIAVQSDNKIIIVGDFTLYNWLNTNKITRLNEDGSIDTGFITGNGFNRTVRSIEIDNDERILVGGDFYDFNGIPVNRLARLTYTGQLDTDFNTNIDHGFNNYIYTIKIQNDDKILIGGDFTGFNGNEKNRLIRLNEDGTEDMSFNLGIGFNSRVRTTLQQSDGNIIVGGAFTGYNGSTINRIIRLDQNGSQDGSFNIGNGFNSTVTTIALDSYDNILAGGSFTSYDGTTINRIVRLLSNGTIDSTFNIGSGFNSTVYSINIQSDGRIIVGGNFTGYQGIPVNHIARLNDNGSLDTSFNSNININNIIYSIKTINQDELLIGGSFTGIKYWNLDLDLLGLDTSTINFTGSFLSYGTIGNCTTDNIYTYYTGLGIGNDFCIAQKGSDQVIIGLYNINIYSTLFSLTGTNPGTNTINIPNSGVILEIQNQNLTGFQRTISGTNNKIKTTTDIFNKNLIGLYNFDKILLADSQTDFSPTQGGKNRKYLRKAKGIQTYQPLQYYAPTQQRIISTPIINFDNIFIESHELNPGYNYGDVVVGRTSPTNATIEIQYTLSDANTTCGDGIKYKLLKNTMLLATGGFEEKTITTQIFSGENIYLLVNSSGNNDCDNTNYNIKIYQLPETNIGSKGIYQGNNSGALYASGKYNGALDFSGDKYIEIGTGIQSGAMSIAARAYKGSGSRQTLIQKRGSYGICINNNTLQVTNQNTNRRYNTQIILPDDTRTHIGRSHDGTTMKVYINGKEQRSGSVNGTIPNNSNTTYLGYSLSNGPRNGLIDELYIYDKYVTSGVFATLYEHNINKISLNKRQWFNNQSGSVLDGTFNFTGTVNGISTITGTITGTMVRDFTPPIFTGFIGLTAIESEGLIITGFGYDSGSFVSGYQFRYNITGTRNDRSSISSGNQYIISGQDEPSTGLIEIKIIDDFGYETIGTGIIQRINTGPILTGDSIFYGKIDQNIVFSASGYDIGGEPLTYQWYFGSDCDSGNKILGKTGTTFTTGSNIIGAVNFSYHIFDKQGSGSCKNIIGNWEDDNLFQRNRLYINGPRGETFIKTPTVGWFSGEFLSTVENGERGSCTHTTGQDRSGSVLVDVPNRGIKYTPNTYYYYTGSKVKDYCVMQDIEGKDRVIGVNMGIAFNPIRTPEITPVNKTSRNIIRTGIIPISTISSFTGTRNGITTQGQSLGTKNITIYTGNIIRKYSFDTIEITDSQKDFGYLPGQYGRKYLRNNGSVGGNLAFNRRTKSRIINEPLQDYEYLFINSGSAYPGATKYGNIIYERTSNIKGNIDIKTHISNANSSSCPSSDGILYQIKKGTTEIYTMDFNNTKTIANILTTTGNVNIGDKLYFIIDSKGNNQCDKINFNVKIYQDSTNDYGSSGQYLLNNGVSLNNGKFYGGYLFGSATGQYIDIGIINQKTGLSFATWIKTTSVEDQTIIYKEGSYGLTIKDGLLKATTNTNDTRRYPTNTQTTNILTNGSRNHIVRTYDGTTMVIYINGNQTRSGRIVGYYSGNNNPSIVGRSTNNGQFNGSLDELQVWNKTLNQFEIENLYYTQISKVGGRMDEESREFSLIQTGLADGIYTFTGYINGTNIITGTTIIDLDSPIVEIINTTSRENTGLLVTTSGYDNGTSISGYQYRWKIGSGNRTNYTERTGNSSVLIPSQNEPITGIIEIKVIDQSDNQTTLSGVIERQNITITTSPVYTTGYEGTGITFVASGYDPGGTTNTGYQRFSGTNCAEIITGATGNTLTIQINEPGIRIFSYRMRDAQGFISDCSTSTTTGLRENIAPTTTNLYVNANGGTGITFVASGYDPGDTIFSGAWYQGSGCTGNSIATGLTFTTGSTKSGTWIYSYYLQDAQGATGNCSIATGFWPHINPIAYDFILSGTAANSIFSGNRRTLSQVWDSEYDLTVTGIIYSTSKGTCHFNSNILVFQPNTEQSGTGYCELKLTDNNNGITYIKGYALNIDTTLPQTTVSGTNEAVKLLYNDISTGFTYYKLLTGVWNVSSCGNSGYNTYISGSTIPISYISGINDNKTLCYYSKDINDNQETIKTQLFNQDTTRLSVNISSTNTYVNNLFQATISVNKACSGTLTGLNGTQILNFNAGGNYIVTGSFLETSGPKTAYFFLQTNNPAEGTFSYSYPFTIDQLAPTAPIITETLQYNDYYSIKRSESTDQGAGILGYNYQVINQAATIVKSGFTDVTYLNIFKSEVQNNSLISIKVQAQDKVNNYSSRSTPTNITIIQTQQPTTIDVIPNQFSFRKTTNAKRNTEYSSNEIVIGGLSTNTNIPVTLSGGTLFINDSKISNNSGTVKNGDIIYIKLNSSTTYSDTTQATLLVSNISATYTITTESKTSSSNSSTSSFLDELKKLLEELKDEDTSSTSSSTSSTGIDTKWISAPYIAPNGKSYTLYKTLDGKYSAKNFIYKKMFNSLSELKQYIDKNNPRK